MTRDQLDKLERFGFDYVGGLTPTKRGHLVRFDDVARLAIDVPDEVRIAARHYSEQRESANDVLTLAAFAVSIIGGPRT